MRTVSATEAKQNKGALLDSAQSEPVVIQRQKRDIAVIVSARESRGQDPSYRTFVRGHPS